MEARFNPRTVHVGFVMGEIARGRTSSQTTSMLCQYNSTSVPYRFRPCMSTVYKVKCTLVQTLRLCTGRTAHRGSRVIAVLFHDHGTGRGWGVSVTPQPLFTPGKDPVPIVQKAGWDPGPVWTGAENLAPTGIRYPDRPARSQSLYRLRYAAHVDSI